LYNRYLDSKEQEVKMDTVDIVAVTLGVIYIGYMVYQAMYERNAQIQAKIDAEIDRLHR